MNFDSVKQKVFEFLDFPLRVAARFKEDRCARHAAALSYSALLALAPMMAIAFSILSLGAFESLGQQLEQFIYRNLVPTAGDIVHQYLDQFAGQAGKLTAVGLLFFLLTALLLLFNIEESFNDIWRVNKGRPLGQRLTVYWAMITLGPLLMGGSLSLSTYFLSLRVADVPFSQEVQSAGILMLPFIFEMAAFFVLYAIMPNVDVKWRHALAGALVATLLFELTKRGFAMFIVNFNNYEIVYGALATIPIFLIWIFLSWMVTLVGAEVVAVLQERKLLE